MPTRLSPSQYSDPYDSEQVEALTNALTTMASALQNTYAELCTR